MNKKYTWILVLVVLAAVLIAGYLLLNTAMNKKGTTKNTTNGQVTEQSVPKTTVTFTASGFNPQTITVKIGTRVIWSNKSGATGTINSDNYPTNLLFPFLNLGRFNDGSRMSTLFNKLGKYTYHNQLNPTQKGTVIVK